MPRRPTLCRAANSWAAAEEAGLTPNYDLTDVQPGETKTFTLAAYGPRGTARRIAYVLDVTARGGGIADRRAGSERRDVAQRSQHRLFRRD